MTGTQRHAWALVICCVSFVEPVDVGSPRTSRSSSPSGTWTAQAQGSGSPALSAAIESLVAGGRGSGGRALSTAEREQLQALYEPDHYQPLWLDAAGQPGTLAEEALGLLVRAPTEGLDAGDYDADRLTRLGAFLDGAAPAPPTDAAAFDVALSHRTLTYLRHLHSGRVDPETVGFHMRIPVDHHDFPELLRSAIRSGRISDTVAELTPPLILYRDLRDALARYRSLAAKQELDVLPVSPRSIRPGDTYPGLPALHRQLVVRGDLSEAALPPAADTVYEGILVQGVIRFQTRHGLEPDGIVGNKTFAALRVPLSWRIRQIELALERLRWIPHLKEGRGILVNIPMFRLWAWDSMSDSQAPSFVTDVIVGRALNTQTPVFDEELRYLIFRPYWNIPRSITLNEILPALARDPGYLERENMDIVSGPGDDAPSVPVTPDAIARVQAGSLRIRQRPGPSNALGLLKFVFPNDNAVYLHDTPATSLFNRSRRDFSHGCVRVQDPVGLAAWALRDRPEWSRERIAEARRGPDGQRVDLPQSIQMILFYVTAAVEPEDKTVLFADDIYDHDSRLDRALTARSSSVR